MFLRNLVFSLLGFNHANEDSASLNDSSGDFANQPNDVIRLLIQDDDLLIDDINHLAQTCKRLQNVIYPATTQFVTNDSVGKKLTYNEVRLRLQRCRVIDVKLAVLRSPPSQLQTYFLNNQQNEIDTSIKGIVTNGMTNLGILCAVSLLIAGHRSDAYTTNESKYAAGFAFGAFGLLLCKIISHLHSSYKSESQRNYHRFQYAYSMSEMLFSSIYFITNFPLFNGVSLPFKEVSLMAIIVPMAGKRVLNLREVDSDPSLFLICHSLLNTFCFSFLDINVVRGLSRGISTVSYGAAGLTAMSRYSHYGLNRLFNSRENHKQEVINSLEQEKADIHPRKR